MSSDLRHHQGPKLLPGPSSAQLVLRGQGFIACTFICMVAIGFESFFKPHEAYWTGPWLTAGFCMLLCYGGTTYLGFRKRKREIASGYSTVLEDATKHPELYYVHPNTQEVVCGPFEKRPSRITRRGAKFPDP